MSTWAKALLCLVAVTGCGSPSTPRPRAPTAAAQRYRARAPRGLHLALELGIKVALLGDRFRSANAEAWVAA
ncbi:MAG: hypothetical protein KC503_32385, partial [Myxococcales bacterium]|nr:hypothetical protein [Myxococcales bacterium]